MAATETAAYPLTDLTAFQRDTLRVIESYNGDDPLCGLDIKRRLERVYEAEVHHGRLYPNLRDLSDKGLVESQEVDGRTNEYRLTRRGRRELEAHREWFASE